MKRPDLSKLYAEIQETGHVTPLVNGPARNHYEIKQKAISLEIAAMYRQQFKYQLLYEPETLFKSDPELQALQESLGRFEQQKANSGISAKDTVGYFITINPEFLDVELEDVVTDLVSATARFVKKKAIAHYMYTFEQIDGTHPHVHIVVILDKTNQASQPTRFKRGVQSTFGKLCDTSKNFACNIKPLTLDTIKPRISYVQGNKNKDYNPLPDVEFREVFGLQPIYVSPGFPNV